MARPATPRDRIVPGPSLPTGITRMATACVAAGGGRIGVSRCGRGRRAGPRPERAPDDPGAGTAARRGGPRNAGQTPVCARRRGGRMALTAGCGGAAGCLGAGGRRRGAPAGAGRAPPPYARGEAAREAHPASPCGARTCCGPCPATAVPRGRGPRQQPGLLRRGVSAADGRPTYAPHGAGCGTCIAIALETKRLAGRGVPLAQIRRTIDATFGGARPGTPTPPPPE